VSLAAAPVPGPHTRPIVNILTSSQGKGRSIDAGMLTKAELKRLRGLARARERSETGDFLVEGVRAAEELLASPVVPKLALISTSLEDTPRGARLARNLRERVETIDVADHQIAAVATTDSPQGVVVRAAIPVHTLDGLRPATRSLAVVLDAVQDPGNFGSIVRSAHAFGAEWICALPGTVDPWNPKAVRAAAGSSLHVPIVHAEVGALALFLRAHAYRTLGADAGGQPVGSVAAANRTALVLGNEGAGLGTQTRALLDGLVAVPIRSSTESLNVGVAAGILLYELSREL
jgi:RNA methyltransferase, TrmH family